MFEYFLNPQNHKAGIPLDAISYHYYYSPAKDEPAEAQQFTAWDQTAGFLNTVRYVEAIRKRLSPRTATMINEVGAISADDGEQNQPGHVTKPIPGSYWNLCGALYAYLFGELANMGIETVNASQLVGYPTQYPSVSLVDWETGEPNARFWVLKLLKDHFGPGDKLVRTAQPGPYVYAQAFVSGGNKRRLLLVNRRNRDIEVTVPGAYRRRGAVCRPDHGVPAGCIHDAGSGKWFGSAGTRSRWWSSPNEVPGEGGTSMSRAWHPRIDNNNSA